MVGGGSRRPAAGAAVGLLACCAWGAVVDRTSPLSQPALFWGLQGASLAGAVLGLGVGLSRFVRGAPARLLAAGLALLGWRLFYFPNMVFSGHVASVGEWLLAATGLPIFVYPVFLSAVFLLHALVACGATLLVAPPWRWVRLAILPLFALAALVSFSKTSDFTWLPDHFSSLPGPVPLEVGPGRNPYLEALIGPGYLPNQRVMLLAAGLTYETIPPSPWGTTVKRALEALFAARPFGATEDRVREHYLAYHQAQDRIGCRRLADCPLPVPAPPPQPP